MPHLTEEELVAHYYQDAEPQSGAAHLASCSDCFARYETIRRVLTLVAEAPVPERGEQYGAEVWNRLRWKLGSRRRHQDDSEDHEDDAGDDEDAADVSHS